MNNPLRIDWTPHSAENARVMGYYIFVPMGIERTLAWVQHEWNFAGQEDILFNEFYRIMGKPDDIRNALVAAGYDYETIENVIATSISKETHRIEISTYNNIYNQILDYLQSLTDYPHNVVINVINEINNLKALRHVDPNITLPYGLSLKINPEFYNYKIEIYKMLLAVLNDQRNAITIEHDSQQKYINFKINAEIIAEINNLYFKAVNYIKILTNGRATKKAI